MEIKLYKKLEPNALLFTCKANEKTKQKNEKARSIDDMYTEN